MILIKLYDKNGCIEIRLPKGKRYTLTKDNFSTWEKAEIEDIETTIPYGNRKVYK